MKRNVSPVFYSREQTEMLRSDVRQPAPHCVRRRMRTLYSVRLFCRAQTGRPLRVASALEEIGVNYKPVALSADECRDVTHRERHPLGRVPVLELDDGQVLFDSTEIVLALADLYPDTGLTGPVGSPLRAQVYEWSILAMTARFAGARRGAGARRTSTVYMRGPRTPALWRAPKRCSPRSTPSSLAPRG